MDSGAEHIFRSADALEHRVERLRRRRGRSFRTVVIVLITLFLVFAFLVRMAAAGLPRSVEESIGEAFSSEAVSVELERVTFSLVGMRLHAGVVRMYPRGIIHKPIIEMKGATLKLRPVKIQPSFDWIKSCNVERLQVSIPESGMFDDATSDRGKPLFADFKTIPIRVRSLNVDGLNAFMLRADISCAEGIIKLAECSAIFGSQGIATAPIQRLQGDLVFDPAAYSFYAKASGRFDFNNVCELLEAVGVPEVASEIEAFSFPRSAPKINARFTYNPGANRRLLVVDISADETIYQGVPFSSMSGTLQLRGGEDGRWSELEATTLRATRPEGSIDAKFNLMFRKKSISFQGNSTIDPVRLLQIVRILPAGDKLPFSFVSPSVVTASGFYNFRSTAPADTDLEFKVLSPGLFAKRVRFEGLRATGRMRGREIEVSQLDATAFGGQLSGSAKMNLDSADPQLTASCEASGLAMAQIMDAVNGSDASETRGQLKASISLDGPFSSIQSLSLTNTSAKVSVVLSEGRVFRIPLFSGLTEILASSIPGVDLLVDQNNLSVNVELAKNGRARVSDLDIHGALFSLTGEGYAWVDREIELTFKLHLLNKSTLLGKGVYYVLSPVSMLFAIHGRGTITEPKWSSATLSFGSDSRSKREDREAAKNAKKSRNALLSEKED